MAFFRTSESVIYGILDVAWSFVHKTTVKGPKLSLHAIVTNVLMKIDDLYDLIHDNNEILKLEHIDCSVYPHYEKMQKLCCTNACKEGESLSDHLVPYNYKEDLGKHLIQYEYFDEKLILSYKSI